MKVTVVGKREMMGKSKKTGNEYHFISVHYLAPKRLVVGKAGFEMSLDPAEYPFNSIHIDQEYDVEFSPDGDLLSFKIVK